MRRRTILLFCIFLAACAVEESVVTPPLTPSADVTAVITQERTAESASTATSTIAVTAECTRGDYFDEIDSGGQPRRYLLHVPATYHPQEPAALVLVFHGAGIGAERFVGYSRFSNVADREGFLIVYPEGIDEVWNPSPGSRDVQFISDLIDHLQMRCRVDPNRIYASGHSNGGGMADRLACDLSDRIAAIGTISGAYQSTRNCSPSRPVPVFAIHGTADTIIPYEGIPAWASAWAERNGCDPEPVEIPHNVLIREEKWSNCRDGADVVLYTIVDLGHDWTHDLINFGQTIWDFFEQHTLRG
jgi:polyhydroxybutyrate depolymerase